MNKILKGELESYLKKILSKEKPKSILIITGKNSYKKSEAEVFFNQISLKHTTTFYRKVEKNPYYTEILSFLKSHEEYSFDIIIAYGGGAVIDFSKLVALFKNNISVFTTDFQSSDDLLDTIPIIAIPTTAGSGAESTEFAVIYKENIKFSILNKNIVPKYVILDPKTTFSLSKHQTACSAIDALCQSIESLWAKSKTKKSEKYALKSLELLYPNIIKCYMGDKTGRLFLLEGASYSGKAINISRTTAPHALSYYLTTFHNIPHGEAVAINIEPFIEINFDSIRNEIKIKLFKIFGVSTKIELINCIKLLKLNLGLKSDLSCIENLNIKKYVSFINVERLKNNPVELKIKDIRELINKSILNN